MREGIFAFVPITTGNQSNDLSEYKGVSRSGGYFYPFLSLKLLIFHLLMQQLSGLDATFLYIESTRAPMHVGGVYIFEPSQKGDRIDYYQFRDFIESRLHISRVFRQRLVEAPLDMSHPYWIEDPHFDLEYHLQYVAIPQPGGS
ncbi:MAG TPA: hypothetical protein DCS93_09190, partial [Microscillaceae bacterium]|nr:hypothetical protein [Microscillaceae bacterium]